MREIKNVKPLHYELVLEPDLEKFKFRGEEKVHVDIEKPTNKVVLNAAELSIKSCSLVHGKYETKLRFKLDGKKEELVLNLPKKVSGKAQVLIKFEGTLNDRLVGFYRSRYKSLDGKEKFLATTHFEAADARRAFPCWDSPEYKATFDVSLIVKKGMTPISNMPIVEEEEIGQNKKLVRFGRTPTMSTYLLYMGVGEFEFLEASSGKTFIRVATVLGKKNQGELALEYAKKFLDFFQDYFGIPYPLPKLDLIALPDFASGAMENWGAITFRESGILYDPKNSSAGTKQYIAKTTAHELAHQWFGNLVTMRWWNDLWLNESFATFMETKAVDIFYPEFDFWSQFLDSSTMPAFKLDSLKSSHPIEVEVKSPSQLNEIFDEISYDKGASILRMLENYLGEDAFKRGLRKYLSEHKYGNATTEDLWAALASASKKPVREMMNAWIRQIGYPVVDVDLKNSELRLTQTRFSLENKISDKSKWFIPLSVKTQHNTVSKLMKGKTAVIELKDDGWFKVNSGQYGFYRVRYPEQVLEKLRKAVQDKRLGNLDRWGIQNDLFAFSLARQFSLAEYLKFVKSYANDDDYLVLQDIMDNLYFTYLVSSGEKFWPGIVKHDREFFKKVFHRLGWEPKSGEKHTDALLRSYVIRFLARFGDEDILRVANQKFARFLKDPSSLNPNLRSAVYSVVAWGGDERTYEMLVKLFRRAKSQEEQGRFLSALSSFQDAKLLERALQFSISPDVRSQDTYLIIYSVGYNPYGRFIVWPWIKKNWKKIIEKHGGVGNPIFKRVVQSLGVLGDLDTEKEIKEFFKKNKIPEMEKILSQTLERVRINAKFLDRARREFG